MRYSNNFVNYILRLETQLEYRDGSTLQRVQCGADRA